MKPDYLARINELRMAEKLKLRENRTLAVMIKRKNLSR